LYNILSLLKGRDEAFNAEDAEYAQSYAEEKRISHGVCGITDELRAKSAKCIFSVPSVYSVAHSLSTSASSALKPPKPSIRRLTGHMRGEHA
jgi:hypothetical protein